MAVEPGGIAQDMHRFHVASGMNAIVPKRGSSAGNQSGLSTFIVPQPTSSEEASFQQERAMAQKWMANKPVTYSGTVVLISSASPTIIRRPD